MSKKHTSTWMQAFFAVCLSLNQVTPLMADTGVAFGWDQSASQENMYLVNLTSGVSTAIAEMPSLKTVLVGSHNIDYQTGVALMLGSTGGYNADTLFAAVHTSRLAYAFKVSLASNQLLQHAIIRSSDGAVFVLMLDRNTSTNRLHKATFDSQNGTFAVGSQIADLGAISYSVDGVKLGDDNRLYVLLTDEIGDELLIIDTGSGQKSYVPLATAGHSGLFLCNQPDGSVRLFSFLNTRSPEINTSLVEISGSGAAAAIIPGLNLSMLAGSMSCARNTLRFIGMDTDDSGSGAGSKSGTFLSPVEKAGSSLLLYSFDLSNLTANFKATPLSHDNLKYVGITKSKISPMAAAGLTGKATPKLQLLSSAAIRKCSRQLGRKSPLPKTRKASFRAVARGLLKVKRKSGKCALF